MLDIHPSNPQQVMSISNTLGTLPGSLFFLKDIIFNFLMLFPQYWIRDSWEHINWSDFVKNWQLGLCFFRFDFFRRSTSKKLIFQFHFYSLSGINKLFDWRNRICDFGK